MFKKKESKAEDKMDMPMPDHMTAIASEMRSAKHPVNRRKGMTGHTGKSC